MFKKIATALVLMASPLLGENIGNVEYEVPPSAKEWEMKELKNEVSTTRVYLPATPPQEMAFAVHSNTIPTDISDEKFVTEGLLKGFEMNYFGKKAEGKVVEKTSDSLLYEWWISDEGKEIVHGWFRVFGSDKGTTLLSFQTINIPQLEQERAIWLPVLKDARVNKLL